MIIIKTVAVLQAYLYKEKQAGHSIGFVPTMGALHAGHLSLMVAAKKSHDFLLCSIFINPTQFNNKTDFEKYPVTIEKDIEMLEKAGCDMLFLPLEKEMYTPGEVPVHYNLGYLENVLEGEFRPGHFQGVCRIVDKLLTITRPDTLFLGQKDYQQCMVIKQMMHLQSHHNALKICKTIREDNGLARSSRNMRLDEGGRARAANIYKALNQVKENVTPGNITQVCKDATEFLLSKTILVDYLTIVDAETLQPIDKNWDEKRKIIILVAGWVDEVRLIDNLAIN
jgi:pantoate--beta-alanine ligase